MSSLPRVGFDALFLEYPMTGMGQYALHLWRWLRDEYAGFDVRLLLPADAPAAVQAEALDRGLTGPVASLTGKFRKVFWEQVGLAEAVRAGSFDLVHVPYFAAPMLQRVPYVVTIHDMIPYVLPEYGGSGTMRAYLRLVERAACRARLILTDSEHSRRDIHQYLGIELGRIRAIPLAAGSEFNPNGYPGDDEHIERLTRRWGLSRPFLLNVGGFDRRKRLPQLVEGFARALPHLSAPADLVIAGAPHSRNARLYPPLEPVIRRWGIRDRIRLIGFVSEEEKRHLYRMATAFVFTSEYEGFGLTPLEAMACGAPVISSNRSSLPEVTGDAGCLVDPEPQEIARAIVEVLEDEKLRAELSRASIRRAAQFSWERTAQSTVDAYSRVLAQSGNVV